MNIKSLLSSPLLYEKFSRMLGAQRSRSVHVRENVRPKPGDSILDIGCGPAAILGHLPAVQYWGFDISQKYIDAAIRKFGDRGHFYCSSVTMQKVHALKSFDIVLATGVLHHLNDHDAEELFKLSWAALKQGGRLITLDNCYGEGQSRLARFIISRDRGRYVRTRHEYRGIATRIFADCRVSIRHDLLRIPYTHIILECTK